MGKRKRSPPNIRAELAMLGAMMIRPQEIDSVRKIVSTSMLTVESHRDLFDSLRWMRERRGCIDAAAIVTEMHERGHRDAATLIANAIDAFGYGDTAAAWAVEVMERSGMGPIGDVEG